MNAIVSPALLSTRASASAQESGAAALSFDVSPQFACRYDPRSRALWSSWLSSGVPCFNLELLRDMEMTSQRIQDHFSHPRGHHELKYIIIRSAHKGVFSVGGDLAYFATLIQAGDRARLTEYANAAVEVQYRNFTSHSIQGATTVALLEGDALGGGLECALSCGLVIAERHVKAGFPEVMFNMFPGMGGLSFITRRASKRVADQMARSGRLYSAQELYDLGLVDHLVETGEGSDAVSQVICQRESRHLATDALDKVDRIIRPISLHELRDVARIWVDSALALDERSLAWMRRIHQRQLQVFGCKTGTLSESTPCGHALAA